jgi:dipeptidase D
MILAAFANGADTHGQLEAIFTIQEETTTYGAKHLPKGIIKSKYFINLDNEHDASVVVGSCFSNEFIGNVKIIRTTSSSDTCNMIIKLGGGHSGHSGNDIHKKIININVELFNMLKTLRTKYEFSILDVKTGSVTNSIPGECSVIIHTKHKIISNIKKTLLIQTNLLKETLPSYNKIMLTVESTFSKLKPLKLSDSDKLIHLVCAANNGLNRYNFERSVTELSTNLAIIKLQDATASIV